MESMVEWKNVNAIRDGKYYEVPSGPYNWMGFPPGRRYWMTYLIRKGIIKQIFSTSEGVEIYSISLLVITGENVCQTN